MTPSIRLLKKHNISYKIHQYEHDSSCASFGDEAALKLNLKKEQVFKTLVVVTNTQEFIVAVVPVSHQLSFKAMSKAFGAKKVAMADAKDVEKITGYILGGVSPLGQKKRLKTIIDLSAKTFKTIFVSGGKRGLDIELSPYDLQKLLDAKFEEIGVLH